jgi:short-subunit dehydrogenase
MRSIPGPAEGIAWVTGASSGIGREVAVQLAQAGWTVAVSARRRDALEQLADSYPGQMIVAALDITDAAAVLACRERIEAISGGKVVRAVLNAGVYARDGARDFDAEEFRAQVAVNLQGTANCLAALLPGLLAARRGQIGVVASLAGLAGLPGLVTYGATKAGLLSMCQSLKFDLDRAGVGISVILPGYVKTPLTDKNAFPMPFLMEAEEAAARMLAGMDAGKFLIAFPGQLAWPTRFLRLLPAPVYTALVSRFTKW